MLPYLGYFSCWLARGTWGALNSEVAAPGAALPALQPSSIIVQVALAAL